MTPERPPVPNRFFVAMAWVLVFWTCVALLLLVVFS